MKNVLIFGFLFLAYPVWAQPSTVPAELAPLKGTLAEGGRYRVAESDVSVQGAMGRMARAEGKTFVWAAGPSKFQEAPLVPSSFNEAAGLSSAVTYGQAFARILRLHEQLRSGAGPLNQDAPLFGCTYQDKVFVIQDRSCASPVALKK